MKEPIESIEWIHHSELSPNNYNPNVVFTPELKLLERSILLSGWIQPIIINPERIIIDGFHRYMLSRESKALNDKYGGRVPCVVLPIDRPASMCMTIRINRAKGSHVAVRMSGIVHELINTHNMTPREIADLIGATMKEVELLYQDDVFKAKNIKDYKYSKAWYPIESTTAEKIEVEREEDGAQIEAGSTGAV